MEENKCATCLHYGDKKCSLMQIVTTPDFSCFFHEFVVVISED